MSQEAIDDTMICYWHTQKGYSIRDIHERLPHRSMASIQRTVRGMKRKRKVGRPEFLRIRERKELEHGA